MKSSLQIRLTLTPSVSWLQIGQGFSSPRVGSSIVSLEVSYFLNEAILSLQTFEVCCRRQTSTGNSVPNLQLNINFLFRHSKLQSKFLKIQVRDTYRLQICVVVGHLVVRNSIYLSGCDPRICAQSPVKVPARHLLRQ